jgi:hypothetical protein
MAAAHLETNSWREILAAASSLKFYSIRDKRLKSKQKRKEKEKTKNPNL